MKINKKFQFIASMLLSLLVLLGSVIASNATSLLPNGKQNFFNVDGTPCVGCSVYFYIPSTTTPKNTWQDSSQVTLNTNPVITDSAGTAVIYGAGQYRQILKDTLSNVIWDRVTSDLSVSGVTEFVGTSGGTSNAQTVSSSSFTNSDGQSLAFRAGFTNTTTMNIIVSGGSPITVRQDTYDSGPVALSGGEVHAGNLIVVQYDATSGFFHLVNNSSAASLNRPNTFTAAQTYNSNQIANGQVLFNYPVRYLEQTLTYGATIAFDPTSGPNSVVTLTGASAALSAITNQSAIVGAHGQIRFIQDATGGRTLSLDTSYVMSDGAAFVLNTAANSETKFNYWIKSSSGAGSVILTAVMPNGYPVLLNTLTASNSASLSDTTSFTSSYRYYRIVFENVVPVTNLVNFTVQPQVSGTFQTVVTVEATLTDPGTAGNSSLTQSNQNTAGVIGNSVSNVAGGGLSGEMLVLNPANASNYKLATYVDGYFENATTFGAQHGTHCYIGSTAAVTGYKFIMSSGNISTGVIKIWGWN